MGKFKAIDLFSGCGGLTLGLKYAGFQVIAAVEAVEKIAETYKSNHKEVDIFNVDIRKIKMPDLMRKLGLKEGELDLLAGCPPCQGFSSIKNRNGKQNNKDERNKLIFEFLRFVRALKPKTIMLENVSGIIKYHKFNIFIMKLEKLGYKVKYKICNVADYGVPQRRKRLICIGALGKEIDFAPPEETRLTVRQAIGHLPVPGNSGDELHDITTKHSYTVMQRIKRIPADGGSRASLPDNLVLACHRDKKGFNDIYGRLRWDDVAPTITCGCYNPSKGRFLHPEQNRAITLREAATLQGFPEDYIFPLNKTLSGTMIGNALPPPFIKQHSIMILKHLTKV
jgi:DNA (cytosine-5)-methyltransferase 1